MQNNHVNWTIIVFSDLKRYFYCYLFLRMTTCMECKNPRCRRDHIELVDAEKLALTF